MKKNTYRKAGVDIARADIFKKQIVSLARKSRRSEVLRDIGGFGSYFGLPPGRYKKPVLVSSCDGVGTKLKIAVLANRHDTIGLDAVAMNVNDILCAAAEPLFFLDYIAYSKLSTNVLLNIVKGVNDGCIEAGCSLIGGETAQMPDIYRPGEYDLAGFCVGLAEQDHIIDGSLIEAYDLLIGLAASGIHSNGYSLVRKVLPLAEQKRMSAQLLMPTRIYVKPVLSILRAKDCLRQRAIKGIAHITGGAFYDKIARILPDNLSARIDKSSWTVPEIFRFIQSRGNIGEREMYHTFNMGIGMVLVCRQKYARAVLEQLAKFRLPARIIGEISRGRKEVFID